MCKSLQKVRYCKKERYLKLVKRKETKQKKEIIVKVLSTTDSKSLENIRKAKEVKPVSTRTNKVRYVNLIRPTVIKEVIYDRQGLN